ncbi:MAG: PIN domain-containing protein [Thermoguttaceae bacterium]
MKRLVLLDTGPLVAFLDLRDKFHALAVAHWANIEPPFLTCESVLAEACYLLRSYPKANAAVMELLRRGLIQIPFHVAEHADPVAMLMKKHQKVPMSLADACLVRMADIIAGSSVFTLDSDFRLYRKANRTILPVIIPDISRSK